MNRGRACCGQLTFLHVGLGGPLRVSVRVRVAVVHHGGLLILVVDRRGWRGRRRVVEHGHVVGGRRRGRSWCVRYWGEGEEHRVQKPHPLKSRPSHRDRRGVPQGVFSSACIMTLPGTHACPGKVGIRLCVPLKLVSESQGCESTCHQTPSVLLYLHRAKGLYI